MYPECRHILPDGNRCRSAALAKNHWCYFHARLHRQEDRRKAGLRSPARRSPDGRFLSQAQAEARELTLDHGTYPVPHAGNAAGQPHPQAARAHAEAPPAATQLPLPTIEDHASIQLALIEVLHALAANQIDTRRASLLLYGLQVAAQNVRHIHTSQDQVRSITYAANGAALSVQEYGYDIEDMEEADAEDQDEA
jgi:hypothetical protein